MQTIDEVREHCRFVGKGIEKMVADGGDGRLDTGRFVDMLLGGILR